MISLERVVTFRSDLGLTEAPLCPGSEAAQDTEVTSELQMH